MPAHDTLVPLAVAAIYVVGRIVVALIHGRKPPPAPTIKISTHNHFHLK
jgi:hypothetical protein